MVLYVIFKSFINFELIFYIIVYGWPMFFFSGSMDVQLLQQYLKDYASPNSCFYTSGKNPQLGAFDGSVSEPRTQNNF